MSPIVAARIVWILGGKNIDPRTGAYFEGKVKR